MRRPKIIPRVMRMQLAGDILRLHPEWGWRKIYQTASALAISPRIPKNELKLRLMIGYKGFVDTEKGRVPVTLISEKQQILLERIWRAVRRKQPRTERQIQLRLWKRLNAEEGRQIAERLRKAHPDWSVKQISEIIHDSLSTGRLIDDRLSQLMAGDPLQTLYDLDFLREKERDKRRNKKS